MKYYIGIDIGGMSAKAGIVNDSGNIIMKGSCKTVIENHYSELVKDVYKLCTQIIEKAGLKKADIEGIGIGCPGTVWYEKGLITFANNLKYYNVPLSEEFRKHWNTNVYLENDANCAALGENAFGSGKGSKNSIFITLGTGVGSGIILDGKIFSGNRGAGAEAGHMVIKIDGEKCTCGRRGCWEAYASASALIRDTKKTMDKYPDTLMHKVAAEYGKVSGKTAFIAAKQNDKIAKKVVKRYVKYIGTGIVNLLNIFRPDNVIIGGGISKEGQYFIDMIQKYTDKYHYGGKLNPRTKIIKATLLNDAGIIGAATLAIKSLEQE